MASHQPQPTPGVICFLRRCRGVESGKRHSRRQWTNDIQRRHVGNPRSSVLRAAAQIFENGERPNIRVSDIERALECDKATVQRALRALHNEPFFRPEGSVEGQTGFAFIGPPTGQALRVAGQWPTPESVVERMIAAFDD